MRQSDVARFSGDPEFLKLRGSRDALQARIDAVRQTLVTIPSSQSNAEARRKELSAILDAAALGLTARTMVNLDTEDWGDIFIGCAGGGDTVSALNHAGAAEKFTYISTAGGAFLEWLEGKALPGVECLRKA